MEPLGVNWGFVLTQLLIFALILALIVGVVMLRMLRRKDSAPLDILKARLARGEISVQEYERLRALVLDETSGKPKRKLDEDSTVDSLEGDIYETAASRHLKRDDDR